MRAAREVDPAPVRPRRRRRSVPVHRDPATEGPVTGARSRRARRRPAAASPRGTGDRCGLAVRRAGCAAHLVPGASGRCRRGRAPKGPSPTRFGRGGRRPRAAARRASRHRPRSRLGWPAGAQRRRRRRAVGPASPGRASEMQTRPAARVQRSRFASRDAALIRPFRSPPGALRSASVAAARASRCGPARLGRTDDRRGCPPPPPPRSCGSPRPSRTPSANGRTAHGTPTRLDGRVPARPGAVPVPLAQGRERRMAGARHGTGSGSARPSAAARGRGHGSTETPGSPAASRPGRSRARIPEADDSGGLGAPVSRWRTRRHQASRARPRRGSRAGAAAHRGRGDRWPRPAGAGA